MTSTFGGLTTAASGLNASRTAIDVAGQNIANANTDGYTRQRVQQASVGISSRVGPVVSPNPQAGSGVQVTGIARLADARLDARVRDTAASSGYHNTRATALTALEAGLQEPGPNGISSQLTKFWSSWADLSNHPDQPSSSGVVIQNATILASSISSGYRAVDQQWTATRTEVGALADQLNTTATQIAQLNTEIRTVRAAGGSINDLLDKRALLEKNVSTLAGGTVVHNDDGTSNVYIGGNPLVSADTVNTIRIVGGTALGDTVQVEWTKHPGLTIPLDGGTIAGDLSLLAPANASGNGGALAEAAAVYNGLATDLATRVNQIHSTGVTANGSTGLDFFSTAGAGPAALNLTVLATGPDTVAAAAVGAGARDGSIADQIASIGTGASTPNTLWARFVTSLGVTTAGETSVSKLADLAASDAVTAQQAQAGVDLDEENVNLLTAQTSYQANARVLTAVDEMLDTLINKTGLVGR